MTERPAPSVCALLADLHAYRLKTMAAADLQVNITASAASQAHSRARGGDLGSVLGTGQWELPMPTIVVIGQDSVVRFADIHPDWLMRTEASAVIEAVRSLATVSA
jgi:hypothetical protein